MIISDRAAQRAADYVEKHLDVALMFGLPTLRDAALRAAPPGEVDRSQRIFT